MTTVAEALSDMKEKAQEFIDARAKLHEEFKEYSDANRQAAVREAVAASQKAMNDAHTTLKDRIEADRKRDKEVIRELEEKLLQAAPADGARDGKVADRARQHRTAFNNALEAKGPKGADAIDLEGAELIAFQQRYQQQAVQWFRSQVVGNDLSAGRLSEGGWLMPPAMSERIRDYMLASDPIWSLADTMPTTAWEANLPTWVGEPESRYEDEDDAPATTDTPSIVNVTVPLSFLSAYPRLSRAQMKSDPDTGIVQSLENQVRSALMRKSAKMFTSGPGNGKLPLGFANRPQLIDTEITPANWGTGIRTVKSGHNTEIFNKPEIIRQAMALLPQPYRLGGNLGWALSAQTFADVQTIKLSDGTFPFSWQFQPDPGELGMATGQIFGKRAYEFPSMADAGTQDATIMVYGNIEMLYSIRYQEGLSILPNPYTEAPWTKFHIDEVNGGRVTDYRAAVYVAQKG